MALYLSVAVFLFGLAFLRLTGNIRPGYEVPLAFSLTVLAYVLSFIRWETGTDWALYLGMYEDMTTLEHAAAQSWWEPGYTYLAVLLNSFGIGYTGFLLCIATILFWTKYRLLIETCSAPLVAIFVLFCGSFYDIFFVRQSVAVVFFWAFVYYHYKRNRPLTALTAAAAMLFHYSAALPIGLVLLGSELSWRRAVLLGAGVLAGVYILWSTQVLDDAIVAVGLSAYIGSGFVEAKASELSTTARAYLKLTFWFFVVVAAYLSFLKNTRASADTRWNAFCLRAAAVIMLATAALLPISEIFARLPAYAVPLFAVVLSDYDFRLRNIKVRSAAYIAALMLMFVQLVFSYSGYADAYYPFRTIFDS